MREHARRKGGNEAGRQAVREERRERKEREKERERKKDSTAQGNQGPGIWSVIHKLGKKKGFPAAPSR